MNRLIKKLLILMLVAILMLAGCAKENDSKPAVSQAPDTSSVGNENEPVPEQAASHDENIGDTNSNLTDENADSETMFKVQDSKQIQGWKELIVKDYAYTTEDWESYSFRENSPIISYSLHFPSNWNVDYSIFTDENGAKVAELLPTIIMKEGQSLLDNWEPNSECELISRENIKVGDLTGVKIILKSYPYGGDIEMWYPHTYYLTDGKQVFIMSFYALELDSEEQELFDKIIKTFQFLS